MTDTALSNPFPPATEAQWRAAVDRALKGGDFEAKLVSRTADGITVRPLDHRRPDAAPVIGARAGQPWRISARVDHPDTGEAGAQALRDLQGGADALTLVFQGAWLRPAHHERRRAGRGAAGRDARPDRHPHRPGPPGAHHGQAVRGSGAPPRA